MIVLIMHIDDEARTGLSGMHSRNQGKDFQASQAAIKPRIKNVQVWQTMV